MLYPKLSAADIEARLVPLEARRHQLRLEGLALTSEIRALRAAIKRRRQSEDADIDRQLERLMPAPDPGLHES